VESAGEADEAKREADQAKREADQAKQGAEDAADSAQSARDEAAEAADDARVAAEEPTVIVDANPETLIDERRTEEHPRPFGSPGRPLQRSSPFYFGFFGALGVLLAYVLVRAVADARQVLVLVVVAMFLAVGLNPLVERLMGAGLRRGPAVACVFLVTLLAFGGIGYAIVPPVLEQTGVFIQTLPANLEHLQQSETINRLNERFGVILALYFLASLPSIKRQVYALVPASRRQRITFLGDEILIRIGGYVSGVVVVAVIAGIAAYVFLLLAHVPYALPLAILGGLLSLIPMIGATIALVIMGSVAFFHSVAAGIATVIFYLIYQQVENYLIYPRVMRRSIDVPPAITVIAALAGGALMGVVGALLAIPAAAAALLLVREVLVPRQDRI
jgi:predicted PurR-regulated permease PerM